jgi:hypothetical protein
VTTYSGVLRLPALLIVLAFAAPSIAPLACDWTCGRQHQAATQSAGTDCHDHGLPRSDSPALSAAHGCHELLEFPTTTGPSVHQPTPAPIVVQVLDSVAADNSISQALASASQLRPQDPPGLITPLRI